ncbi:tetratricopeptide repeat protein [Aquabacter spiritensis]|uniref:Tetratricopeptide repeat protein n=1 Tax=Aquabacter spiritensis TaxID=933073 RepID=A0A4R3M1A4_9HYPH|nr:tetratricopeptide repeat protein [Aquabacter spiritensis]TCT06830.1 tetratricopeptide repeat protein [Aquabacter spiritensis]
MSMPPRPSVLRSLCAVLLCAPLLGGALFAPGDAARAQSGPFAEPRSADARSADPRAGAAPPPSRPALPRDRRTQLDALFEALRLAPDEASSKALGTRLDSVFAQTGSMSADILMGRADLAAQAKEYDLALELLDSALVVVPDNLAILSRRAAIKYAQDDYAGSLADLGEVLTREPRHYTALLGLALIMREVGDDKRALEAARRALAVNPNLDAAKDIEESLTITVEGREI